MIRRKDFSEFSCLNETRINRIFCDVNIRVGDRSFPCHRLILFATMKYFCGMFSGEYVEAKNDEIELKDMNADDFEQLLAFVYGESVPVSEENILRLLQLANYLKLETMEASCTEYLVENHGLLFSLDSVIDIFGFACASGNISLTDILAKHIAENFVNSAKTGKLYRVSGSDLLKIFVNPHLERNINVILTFLKEWIKFHSDEEKELLPDMLSALHLEKGTAEWIFKTLVEIDKCTPQKDHGSDSQSLSNLEQENSGGAAQLPFLLLARDDYLHRGNNGELPIRIQYISTYKFQGANNAVKTLDNRITCEEEHSQGKSFFVGGTEIILKSEITSKIVPHMGRNILQLYATNSSWLNDTILISTYHGIKCQRSMLIHGPEYEDNIITAATIGTDIYFYDNIEFMSYGCGHSRWSTVQGYDTLDEMIFAPSMVSFGSCLYMVGGLGFTCRYPMTSRRNNYEMLIRSLTDGGTKGKSFKRYDVRENRWSLLPNLKYPRCKAAACVYNDTIYVSGGDHATYYNNSNMEYYDMRADKWSELTTPMPKAKIGHCLMAYNDHLWFLGGQAFGNGQLDPTWFSYNLKENTWSEVFTLPTVHGQHTIDHIFDVHPDIIN